MKARQTGGWYNIGTGLFEADPVVEGPPEGWQAAFDSGDLELIQEWYEANTGHLTEGFDAGDLWAPDPDLETMIEITPSFLTTNEGPNVIDNGGGDWTIIGLHAAKIRVSVSNVHFEHCFVDRPQGIHGMNGPGVEVYDPILTSFGPVNNVNITFDRCTLKAGDIWKATQKSLTSNVVTLTIGTHPLIVGDIVYVSLFPLDGSLTTFNGQQTITAVTSTTISYAKTAANVASSAADGIISRSLDGDYGDTQYYFSNADVSDWDNYKYSRCRAYYWPAVFKFYRGSTAEYCYVHDLDLYGFDPHNTSSSIRGDHCRLFRNYFTDGTSSDISLYADLQPFEDYEVIENILWVAADHALFEVNFPQRPPDNWHVLSTGMSRVFKGNKLQRGAAGDLQYFSEVSGNMLFDGTKIFGAADTPEERAFDTPSVLAGFGGIMGYPNPAETLLSFPYTPSNNSTLFLFNAIGQAGHDTTPVPSVIDTSGATWAKVTNTQTTVEPAPGNLTAYGLSTVLWTVETGSGEAFRRTTADPYNTTNTAYQTMMIIEMTGVKGMTLAQPRALSASGHLVAWGSSQRTCTSGSFGSAATAGNDVFWFVAYTHDTHPFEAADEPAIPAGWELVGLIRENERTSIAVFWRNDFTGTSVSCSDIGADAGAIVTTLVEFSS
jgi:hypothetical protein